MNEQKKPIPKPQKSAPITNEPPLDSDFEYDRRDLLSSEVQYARIYE